MQYTHSQNNLLPMMYIIEWRDDDSNGGWYDIGDDAYHTNLTDAEKRAQKERDALPHLQVRIVLRMNQPEV